MNAGDFLKIKSHFQPYCSSPLNARFWHSRCGRLCTSLTAVYSDHFSCWDLAGKIFQASVCTVIHLWLLMKTLHENQALPTFYFLGVPKSLGTECRDWNKRRRWWWNQRTGEESSGDPSLRDGGREAGSGEPGLPVLCSWKNHKMREANNTDMTPTMC